MGRPEWEFHSTRPDMKDGIPSIVMQFGRAIFYPADGQYSSLSYKTELALVQDSTSTRPNPVGNPVYNGSFDGRYCQIEFTKRALFANNDLIGAQYFYLRDFTNGEVEVFSPLSFTRQGDRFISSVELDGYTYTNIINIPRWTIKATACTVQARLAMAAMQWYDRNNLVVVNDGESATMSPGERMTLTATRFTVDKAALPVEVYVDGKLVYTMRNSVDYTVYRIIDGQVIELVSVPGVMKRTYVPIFSDIMARTIRPLFADLNTKTFRPLYRAKVGNIISYAFLDRSHLWTRISDRYSNTSGALPDSYFPGRDTSQYEGSSGDSGKNIQVNLALLYAHSSALENADGTKSITLYFFCALCNWGCTSDYESGDVDFSVLWKTFTVANIPRATSDDPGPGNEPLAFSFTITIRKNGNRYLATAVSITDKDGNTY